MEITQDKTTSSITITQTQYLKKILKRFQITKCYPVTTPLDPNVKLDKTSDDAELTLPQLVHEYSAVIGSLNFATIVTRLDLKYMVYELSQFINNPSPIHWTAAKYALYYIKGILNLDIIYLPSNLNPHSYLDVNWGTNLTDKRSVLGYTIMFRGGAISWYLKKQPTVTLSTIEAEYVVLSNITHECLWI